MKRNVRIKLAAATAAALAVIYTMAFYGCMSSSDSATRSVASAGSGGTKKPVDNKPCYVCHLSLKKEEITTIHLANKIGCTDCHGPSIEHIQDEMQMTTPDLKFGRSEVRGMCGACHDDPHKKVKPLVKSFIKKWHGRMRPNGRMISARSICTDCHGTHNIDKELKEDAGGKPVHWKPSFNGKDLSGWNSSGGAVWKVSRGRIVGTPGGKGQGGTLLNNTRRRDYLLAVTFRTRGVIRAGILLREDGSKKSPRVELCRSDDPPAHAASIRLPGRGLALANLDKDTFDPGGWNTISVKVQGEQVAVWLNGSEIGAARCPGPQKGRIGLELLGGNKKGAQLTVREVLVKALPEKSDQPEEK